MKRNRALSIVLFAFVVAASSACGGGKDKETATTVAAPSGCGASAAAASGDNSGPEVNDPGDIPDNQAFVPYSPVPPLYTVKVPEGWARKDESGGVTFTDKFNSIHVQVVDLPAVPTIDSVTATDLPKIKAESKCFDGGAVEIVTRKGGHPVHLTYRADAAPDAVTGKSVNSDIERYYFWRNGKEAILTLSGAHGADNVDPWKIVTDSFAWR